MPSATTRGAALRTDPCIELAFVSHEAPSEAEDERHLATVSLVADGLLRQVRPLADLVESEKPVAHLLSAQSATPFSDIEVEPKVRRCAHVPTVRGMPHLVSAMQVFAKAGDL